jgi:Na+/glutamate symporter
MSEKDNFGGGFLLGTIIGGVVGGIIGTVITNNNNKKNTNNWDEEVNLKNSQYSNFDNEKVEHSRMSLEEKINQLNNAIDDVKISLMKNSEKEIID